jgi:hypothetical protein
MSRKKKQTRVIRLFFSYASEQRSVVSEVNDNLNPDFDIWFDKDKLTGGDSLFEEISEGLNWCDYSVVFLSKDYLNKDGRMRNFAVYGLNKLTDAQK